MISRFAPHFTHNRFCLLRRRLRRCFISFRRREDDDGRSVAGSIAPVTMAASLRDDDDSAYTPLLLLSAHNAAAAFKCLFGVCFNYLFIIIYAIRCVRTNSLTAQKNYLTVINFMFVSIRSVYLLSGIHNDPIYLACKFSGDCNTFSLQIFHIFIFRNSRRLFHSLIWYFLYYNILS